MALKTYNPTSPSRRELVTVDRSHLWKGKPVKKLTEGLSSSGGRNNHGHTTVRFRGGGHKRTYRLVDFKRRSAASPATVERLEYDPNRTAFIALSELRGRRAGLHPGAAAAAGRRQGGGRRAGRREAGQRGAAASIPIGTIVHNIELKPGPAARSPARPGPTPSSSAATATGRRSGSRLGRDPTLSRSDLHGARSARCRIRTIRTRTAARPGGLALAGPSAAQSWRDDEPGRPSAWRRRGPHLGRPPSRHPLGQADQGPAHPEEQAHRTT